MNPTTPTQGMSGAEVLAVLDSIWQVGLTSENVNDFERTRSTIESTIPVGGPGTKGSWSESGFELPPWVSQMWTEKFNAWYTRLMYYHPKAKHEFGPQQLGTLGTGNHFLEVCLDENDAVWLMLHSGSRGLGNKIGRYFIELAKEDMRRWFINLPDEDLAYIPEGSKLFDAYWEALELAQSYAAANRKALMANFASAVEEALGVTDLSARQSVIDCHHNYVAKESHYSENVLLTRKGAINARDGHLGIIPGAMGRKSFIVRGKGNVETFKSCSHGAGRVMSRTEAKKRITLEQHEAETSGLECRKDAGVIDESPSAYKDIDAVMAAQRSAVDIVHTLRAGVCGEGGSLPSPPLLAVDATQPSIPSLEARPPEPCGPGGRSPKGGSLSGQMAGKRRAGG